jgi:AcrR family transcriptional regulator
VVAHEKVLRAALELFSRRGVEGTSMDSIAQASGVSKATIYNHWADKEALLMEVMIFVNGLDREPEDVDTGDICRDLAWVLSRRHPDEFDDARNRITPSLIAYSALHREFGDAWRNRVMEPARNCLRRILCRGIERKLLPATLDMEASLALMLGPILYAHIFQQGNPPPVVDLGRKTAEAFWRAFSVERRSALNAQGLAPQKRHRS